MGLDSQGEGSQVADAQALMLFRTKAGALYQSVGHGLECREWTAPAPLNVKNPDSKVSLMGGTTCKMNRLAVSKFAVQAAFAGLKGTARYS